MTFTEKIRTGIFWINVLKIALIFFITVTLISALFHSFSSVIHFDLEALTTHYLTDGRWQPFFLPKLAISIFYGIWITQRNMK